MEIRPKITQQRAAQLKRRSWRPKVSQLGSRWVEIVDSAVTYLGLGQFVVVMREFEVHASCVDVHGFIVDTTRHNRTLYVPTWPALRSLIY